MTKSITLKLATEADSQRLARLAELDGKHAPHGDVLLAETDGRLLAAIGMDGSVIADPFERTADAVNLLRIQLNGEPARRPRRRRLGRLRRLLPA